MSGRFVRLEKKGEEFSSFFFGRSKIFGFSEN